MIPILAWHGDCSGAGVLRDLCYVSDSQPGLARRRHGRGFRYLDAEGYEVRDADTLARIRSLVIPPAWRDVWICARADGHLQATGRDARGRKQYRYHPRWREMRDETKYGRMAAFARALPQIRARVRRDLARRGLTREKALAVVVRLLETTLIRIGNSEYARANSSFGLTTLRERQLRVDGATLHFRFRGKSRVHHDVEHTDRRIAAIVRRMQDLPGEEIFHYADESGVVRTIESADVNAYLRDIAGDDFTSKDFRTWAGTVLAAIALHELGPAASQAQLKRNVGTAIEAVSRLLGNTRAVCRKCYVHPVVLEAYADGSLAAAMKDCAPETAVLRLLAPRRARALRKQVRSPGDPSTRGDRNAFKAHWYGDRSRASRVLRLGASADLH
jgi:DNA topoisomerase I